MYFYYLFTCPAAVGVGLWSTEADADWTHQCSEGPGCQLTTALPLLSRRGQAGQVLGPRVQQGGQRNKTFHY